ncbi:MAG: GNAT family N-acetyltransferase [Propionibacteriales bacterium]|nr:GNAT family N-acetyltransferase [Propionibacteriales bacterium]
MLEVKVATPDDWEAVRSVRLAALRDAPRAFWARFEDEVEFPERRWRERISTGHNLLALLDGRPIGQATGVMPDGRSARVSLVGMWVAGEARGIGVGARLVEGVCEWAAASGAHRVELWVEEGNDPALRLYERCGFRPTGERQPMPGGDRTELAMFRTV